MALLYCVFMLPLIVVQLCLSGFVLAAAVLEETDTRRYSQGENKDSQEG